MINPSSLTVGAVPQNRAISLADIAGCDTSHMISASGTISFPSFPALYTFCQRLQAQTTVAPWLHLTKRPILSRWRQCHFLDRSVVGLVSVSLV